MGHVACTGKTKPIIFKLEEQGTGYTNVNTVVNL